MVDFNAYKDFKLWIYAYTKPGVIYHEGWLKIGCTERDVDTRIKKQTLTAGIIFNKEWVEIAPYDEKRNAFLKDTDFHSYLITKHNIERDARFREWFKIAPDIAHKYFNEFCEGKSRRQTVDERKISVLRDEQTDAIAKTVDYWLSDNTPREFLWNAKPRFGKTLTAYDFIKQIEAHEVLIVTNRPSIANSWYDTYRTFVAGYQFVSTTDSLKTKTNISYYTADKALPIIAFLSLQDLKGSQHFGGNIDKLDWVKNVHWDLLIVDEAHEGVDTDKTNDALNNITRDFTLYLSGTPFKILANDKFQSEQIFNWTYEDEQSAKINWDSEDYNPYGDFPQINLYTYQLSKIIIDKINVGIDIDGENYDYAFDLNEFFKADDNANFVHKADVIKFLDALTTLENYPFSTPEFRAEHKHTFWLMQRVNSVKAMEKLLKTHPIFSKYQIIVAAGIETTENGIKKSFDKVKSAIANNDKTITLSVGQLTTGVTIPEWTAILMLSNLKSATAYIQAAFRVQNPNTCQFDGQTFRKENCYIFDFDPARTLTIYDEYANTNKTTGTRTENISNLLNFLPVLAEDDNGKMVAIDANKIMTLSNEIYANHIVDNGFMTNAIFDNITNIFSAPDAVKNVIFKIRTDDDETDKPAKTPRTVKLNDNNPPLDKKIHDTDTGTAITTTDTDTKKPLATKRKSEEERIRDKLRAFARAIPSFLMAYGDRNLTLANFETYIDNDDFVEVTGIAKDDFKFLRDGGNRDGEFFDGHFFNEGTFNAAVQKFLDYKDTLSNYFEPNHDKDIFDYIPPQTTRQTFTPRNIVVKMVDALEIENPGIFDNPNQIFIDPYMKSGMYITEIVKKLFNSKAIRADFPNDNERLKHILEHQVYGFAPTKIIYRIATEYIFGKHNNISRRNFFCKDLTATVKNDKVADFIKKNFTIRVIILNKDRIKKFGEVFTPPEIVNRMLDDKNIADVWNDIDNKILEPTAGNGAFLIGILQRKLNAANSPNDMFHALAAIYGIEIQADNLAIAKENLIETFINHYEAKFGTIDDYEFDIAKNIIDANIIQGDALTKKAADGNDIEFIDWNLDDFKPARTFKYKALTNEGLFAYIESEFAVIIGNPPYQLDTKGDNKTYAAPIYHKFLESFWHACNRVMMIHPARCLFNAGGTPKDFMRRMLNDEHLKVIEYWANSSDVFKNVDIKGGVAVTYHDVNTNFGKVGVFIPFPELQSIYNKVVVDNKDFESISKIMRGTEIYTLTDKLHNENPTAEKRLSKGHKYSTGTNIFETLPEIFFKDKPNDGHEYIQMWGRENNCRACKWIRRDYINDIPELHKYKVIIPKSNGCGSFGESVSTPLVGLPLVGLPLVGSTQTFITLGAFDTRTEAEAALKYVKTKFARALLGILKVTQHNPPETWKYVPMQDFSSDSDVDWSRSVREIDEYFYKKYNLTQDEINFIETKVKEMP